MQETGYTTLTQWMISCTSRGQNWHDDRAKQLYRQLQNIKESCGEQLKLHLYCRAHTCQHYSHTHYPLAWHPIHNKRRHPNLPEKSQTWRYLQKPTKNSHPRCTIISPIALYRDSL